MSKLATLLAFVLILGSAAANATNASAPTDIRQAALSQNRVSELNIFCANPTQPLTPHQKSVLADYEKRFNYKTVFKTAADGKDLSGAKHETIRKEQGTGVLTINLQGDDPNIMMFSPFVIGIDRNDIYNNQWIFIDYDENGNQLTESQVTLPSGTYDFIVQYRDMNNGAMLFDVKENVDLSSAATVIFNPADVTVHIEVNHVLADGSPMTLDVYNFNEAGDDVVVTSEGNCREFWALFGLKNIMSLITGSYNSFGESNAVRQYDMYVSPLQDDYYIYFQGAFCLGKDRKISIINYTTNELSESREVVNNPAGFRELDYNMTLSPSASTITGGWGSDFLVIDEFIDGWYNGYSAVENGSNVYEPLKSVSTMNYGLENQDGWLMAVRPSSAQLMTERYDDWMEMDVVEFQYTLDTPVILAENGLFHPVNQEHNIFSKAPGLTYGTNQVEGHPQFSYFQQECGVKPGATAPIARIAWNVVDSDEGVSNRVTPLFYGRAGEERLADSSVANYLFKTEKGEFSTVLEGFDMFDFYYGWEQSETQGLDYTIKITNNNYEIDSLEGLNVTELSVNHNVSNSVPVLQFLQTRDPDGIITDRFEKASDMKLSFAAGSYTPDFDEAIYSSYLIYSPVTVKVEYSPAGMNSWSLLDVTEVPDLYTHDFGAFYTADTSDIDRMSSNGWYDLRFTLTDESGNKQVQTIGLCFSISSLTGISTVADNAETGSSIYGIDGLRRDSLQPGVNIIRNADGSVFKVIRK